MATYSTTSKTFIESDAQFRSMFGHIRSMLSGAGWVQTSDTGQINPSTATYPGANSTDAGYEIWRMADSLQSTRPVYIRMTYGRGSATGSLRWSINVSMTGSDGAGNLTGQTSGVQVFTVGPNPGTRPVTDPTLYRILGSGSTNRIAWSFFPDVATSPFGTFFSLERTKNSDGTDNGNGIVAFFFFFGGNNTSTNTTEWGCLSFRYNAMYQPLWVGSNQGGIVQVLRATGGSPGNSVRAMQDTLSTLNNGKVYAYPFFPYLPGEKYPLMNVLQCFVGDFPVDYSTVTINYYGADHVYIPLGVGPTQVNGPFRNGTTMSFLMRYE